MSKNRPGTEIHGSGKHVVTSPGSVPVAYETDEAARRVAAQVYSPQSSREATTSTR